MRKCVLIISLSDLTRDPRVDRQIRFLRDDYNVVTAGLAPPTYPNVPFVTLKHHASLASERLVNLALLATGSYTAYTRRLKTVSEAVASIANVRADIVLANDAETLAIAFGVSGSPPVVFDAHEYSPRQYEERRLFRWLFGPYVHWLCRKYIPRVAEMSTVNLALAVEFEREFGRRPKVVWNAPDYQELAASEMTPGRIRLLHHGIAAPTRGLAEMLEVLKRLDDRFTLTLMLVPAEGSPNYISELRQIANGNPRVEFRLPVPMQQLAQVGNEYDLGLFLLPPFNFNCLNALPNKFFEFIQARLGIAIGPSPEMARLTLKHDLGVVADDFSPAALAAKLNALTSADVRRFKHNSHLVARLYSAETVRDQLRDVVRQTLATYEHRSDHKPTPSSK